MRSPKGEAWWAHKGSNLGPLPCETSLTGRQVVNWKPAMSALRRGLKDHFDLAIAELKPFQFECDYRLIGL
jgi:hypothetical protein